MKATKIMMFVAAAAMLFATACDKEEGSNTTGGAANTGENSTVANNTIVYDGVVYPMASDANHMVVMYFHDQLTVFSALSVDETKTTPKIALEHFHIRPEMWNTTQNLGTLNEEEFYELVFEGQVLNMMARGSCYRDGEGNLRTYYGGTLDGTEYPETENLFTSGTLTVRGNNDGSPFTVEMDAVLRNGKSLKMKLTSPDYHDQVNSQPTK